MGSPEQIRPINFFEVGALKWWTYGLLQEDTCTTSSHNEPKGIDARNASFIMFITLRRKFTLNDLESVQYCSFRVSLYLVLITLFYFVSIWSK